MTHLLRHRGLKWHERGERNESAPEIEKAVNAVYRDRIDEFATRLGAAEEELSWPAHWIHHDENSDNCEDYCLPCARAHVAELNAEHVARRAAEGNPVDADDEDDAAPWEVRGGYDREDGTAICTKCGAMLDYYFSEHTVEDEAHHFLEQRPAGPVTDATEAVEICRLLEGVKDLGPIENELVERCVALIDLVDLDAVDAEIAARKAGTWKVAEPTPEPTPEPLTA